MTFSPSRQLQTGLAGSLLVHGLLLVLLVAGFSLRSPRWTPRPEKPAAVKKKDKEVVLLFPITPLEVKPPPKAEPEKYIRTTQNQAAAKAPPKAAFASDRNTTAASRKAAAPDATLAMPTTDGIRKPMNELANRDYQDGELREDALPKALPMPQMLTPAAAPGEPTPAAPPPSAAAAPAPPPPAQVAKAEPGATPLAKMMEEMDREAVRLEVNRLPLEIRKPGEPPPPAKAVAQTPPATKPAAVAPQKPAPVADPITAGRRPAADGFSPFTRTSSVKGTITNRGENAVDAEKTPMGVYMRGVTGVVEQKWHRYRRVAGDAVTFGSLKVRFFVTREGKAEDLKIISDPRDADPRMADFTLRAIKDAEIPPIPDDVLPMLDGDRVKIEYDVLIY